MAKFLTTSKISSHLDDLIKDTMEKLILVSPYLQFSKQIMEQLGDLAIQKRDIRIIYREDKLKIKENNWLAEKIGIRTSLCENLHAKCYINEKEAIITSMNLYEYSQQNNYEMGIHITKAEDPELYEATLNDVNRLLRISTEHRLTLKTDITQVTSKAPTKVETPSPAKLHDKRTGYCIRTGISIAFNIEKPMSYDAFKSWSKYSDPDYNEKYCHFSGEPSHGDTSVNRPILKKNWKTAKEIFNL